MAHYRKPLAAAVALNSAIFLVEAFVGFQVNSLSLIMDSVHNLSDELALVFLYLAFVLPLGLSRNLLRSANVFNSIGIIVLSALLLWQATARVLNPAPVWGGVTIVIGLLAALGNWGVARLLRNPGRNNPVIRLDRKSTRLNSSHSQISYAVFCLKKKNTYVVSDYFVSCPQLFMVV